MKNNFRLLVVILGIIAVTPVIAQKDNVGIGTTKPDQSAVLDISSSTKGLLMPRMSLQQRNSIQNPAQGLVVYQTDFLSGFYFYDGVEWKTMTTQNSVAGVDGDWTLQGNAGTNGSTDFIGTTDGSPLVFKVNNRRSGFIDPNATGNAFFGYETALLVSGAQNTGVGSQSLKNLTSGNNNTAFGYRTLVAGGNGGGNTAIGSFALESNTSGYSNIAIGVGAMKTNTNGGNNISIGPNALYSLNDVTGVLNIAIGAAALYSTTNGNNNLAIGAESLKFATGNFNVGIGANSGSLSTGNGSIFIGYQAGQNETGSNKLYIANTNTTTPLIYGDFATKYLAVGEVAAADRAAATSGGYRLLVKGGMITEKIKVAVAGSADWADYVFEPSYKLMSLDKVESFVKENKHLPNVPSAEEMSKNGLDVMQTSAKLMEKIEELTLYMIEMNKEIKALKEENAKLKK